jgi:hypothetical protein
MVRSIDLQQNLDIITKALADVVADGNPIEDFWDTLFNDTAGESQEARTEKFRFMDELPLSDMEFDMTTAGPNFNIVNRQTHQAVAFSNRGGIGTNELRGEHLRAALTEQKTANPHFTLRQALQEIISAESPMIEATRRGFIAESHQARDALYTNSQFDLLVKIAKYTLEQRKTSLNKADVKGKDLEGSINMHWCHDVAKAFSPIMDLLDAPVEPAVQPFMKTLKNNLVSVICQMGAGEIPDHQHQTACLNAITSTVELYKNPNTSVVDKIKNVLVNLFKHGILSTNAAAPEIRDIKSKLFKLRETAEKPQSTTSPRTPESQSLEEEEDDDEHPSPS